ncbi:MAG: hypothetical protein N2643_00160 [Endomicrobia bacterium]|nr:hypothetical protein [Endomicrobiia bacterium]
MKIWIVNNYKKIIFILMIIFLVYFAIYVDVILRAKTSYENAERYLDWHFNPEKKMLYLEQQSNVEKKKLEEKYLKGKISKHEYEIGLELIDFDKKRQLEESSLKYAYIWYKTAIDLFNPPESKWVKLSKEKIKQVKKMWKKELESKGYKVEDYMLE